VGFEVICSGSRSQQTARQLPAPGAGWARMGPHGPAWARMMGPAWARMGPAQIRMGPHGLSMGPHGPGWARMGPEGPGWAGWAQMGLDPRDPSRPA
jgi:hypothetical protein